MPDILRTSTSALVAFQRALSVTGNNIANANTDGYSRQRAELSARLPEQSGYGFIGRGVDVTTVRRIYDEFAATTLRNSGTQLGQLTVYADFASRVDNVTGDTNAGLSSSLQAFFNAWQGVANDPASITNRQVLLGQAQALADRFTQLSGRLAAVGDDVTVQLSSTIQEINSLANSIATLNGQITIAQASTGQPPNDLLDMRDQLLLELGERVDVQATADLDGALNVFIGSGQPLVLRAKAFTLQTIPNPFDASRVDVSYVVNGTPQRITDLLTGGRVGGLLNVQSDVIDPARNALGRIAIGLADLVNDQQAIGFDLRSTFGQPMFSAGSPLVLGASANTGTAAMRATVPDPAALGTSDFELRYTAGGWTAVDLMAKQAVPVTATAGVPSGTVLQFAGVTVNVNVPPNAGGAPAIGDQWQIRPTQAAAGAFRALLTDPRSIAAAAPVRTLAAPANVGNGAISAGEVMPATPPPNASLLTPVTIRFVSATQYTTDGGTTLVSYTPGANIDVNGWRVRITGAPAVGDTFQVLPNSSGVGDNRNALAMASLASRGLFDGGAVSVSQAYSALVAAVGNDTRQAQVARDAQSAIVEDANANVLRVSGVNLDEEAADLLRWQQAYGAAAKVIAVADDSFNTLLSAIRR
jgi:flagellar hook-associated protein 1 FlgK